METKNSVANYRKARPEDALECIVLRGKTRENAITAEQLAERGITVESLRASIEDGSLPGFVATLDGNIVGYCFGDRSSGEVIVLAMLPAYEGNGFGKVLLNMLVEEFTAQGYTKLFLGCTTDPEARSYGFYRHLGWRSTGTLDEAGDDILEYFPMRQT